MITNDIRYTQQIKSRIAMAKAASNKKTTLFTSKWVLSLRKKLVNCYLWSILVMVLKLGPFRKYIRNTQKVMKCSAG
jgi:hypothetical protein